jgi:hypothetical protein
MKPHVPYEPTLPPTIPPDQTMEAYRRGRARPAPAAIGRVLRAGWRLRRRMRAKG